MARFEGISHVMTKHVSIVKDSKGNRAVQIYLEKEKYDQLPTGPIQDVARSPRGYHRAAHLDLEIL